MSSASSDFAVEKHGSIFLLRPRNDAAREWITENVWLGEPDGATLFGGALVVEHRYIEDIATGIQADGLVVA